MKVYLDGIYSKACSESPAALRQLLAEKCQSGKAGGTVDIYKSVPVSAGSDGSLRMTLSTSDLDRDGERIDQSGWLLENYRKNPVILWAHDWARPAIGYMKELEAGEALTGELVFNDREYDSFGWGIGERLKNGSLRCGSVGFRVIEAEVVNHTLHPEEKADVIFRKQELLEFSICNIPANPNAMLNEECGIRNSGKSLWERLLRQKGAI